MSHDASLVTKKILQQGTLGKWDHSHRTSSWGSSILKYNHKLFCRRQILSNLLSLKGQSTVTVIPHYKIIINFLIPKEEHFISFQITLKDLFLKRCFYRRTLFYKYEIYTTLTTYNYLQFIIGNMNKDIVNNLVLTHYLADTL